MHALAWSSLIAWTAILAATDVLVATCESDCQDSGVQQGLFLLAVIAPAGAFTLRYLVSSGLSVWGKRALWGLGVVAATLIAWLLIIFVGV